MYDPTSMTDEELIEVLYSMDGDANPQAFLALQIEFSKRFPGTDVPSAAEARNVRNSADLGAAGDAWGWLKGGDCVDNFGNCRMEIFLELVGVGVSRRKSSQNLPNKSLQRPPGGACPASCNCYYCGQQAGQSPGAAELKR